MMAAPILIFVRPQAAGNIGALARVMTNFSCSDLRLVGTSPVYPLRDDDPFSRMDWAMATKRGEGILQNARWYPDLALALADVQLPIGTSGRSTEFDRGYARPFVRPELAFQSVTEWQKQVGLPAFKWALVLGPEDDGLSDHESALCQQLVRVPTADASPSLNAAMAAGCLLYHWHLANQPAANAPATAPFTQESTWADAGQKEEFLNYLMSTVSLSKFLKYPDVDAVQARIRRWLQIAPLPLGELLFAFEVVYHLRSWGTGVFEKRNFLKKGVG